MSYSSTSSSSGPAQPSPAYPGAPPGKGRQGGPPPPTYSALAGPSADGGRTIQDNPPQGHGQGHGQGNGGHGGGHAGAMGVMGAGGAMGAGVVTVDAPLGEWASDPFECFDEIESCMLGTFCCWCQSRRTSAWLQGRPAGFVDYGIGVVWFLFDGFTSCMCCCLHVVDACFERKKVKDKYLIMSPNAASTALTPADMAVVLCCLPCARCQHARELIIRGDDVMPANAVSPAAPVPPPHRRPQHATYPNQQPHAQRAPVQAQYVQPPQ